MFSSVKITTIIYSLNFPQFSHPNSGRDLLICLMILTMAKVPCPPLWDPCQWLVCVSAHVAVKYFRKENNVFLAFYYREQSKTLIIFKFYMCSLAEKNNCVNLTALCMFKPIVHCIAITSWISVLTNDNK